MLVIVQGKSQIVIDNTAPYKKCLEFITPTEVIAISEDAPPDKSCRKTICEAPPKIINEVA